MSGTVPADIESTMRIALAALRDSYPRRAEEVRRLLVTAGLTPEKAGRAVRFRLGSPRDAPDGYPTFGATRQQLSPMIQARYRLAGSIKDIGWTFPAAARLEPLHRSRPVRAAYEAHARHWDGSAPMRIPADRLSIFAMLNVQDGSIAYLDWSVAGEPSVWTYADGDERRYADIVEFITSVSSS